jgi:hypothetical protein
MKEGGREGEQHTSSSNCGYFGEKCLPLNVSTIEVILCTLVGSGGFLRDGGREVKFCVR